MTLNRRSFLGAAGQAALLGLPLAARAQYRIDINGVGSSRLPIAVAAFVGDGQGGQSLADIVRADLLRSGMFRLVDAPEAVDGTTPPDFAAWRNRGADTLVTATAAGAGGGLTVAYKVWDVVRGAKLMEATSSASGAPANQRLLAHNLADRIIQQLAGVRGPFASAIAYVTKAGSRHALWFAQSDGEGAAEILTRNQPIISPAWSPDGRTLAYASFENGKAEVFTHVLESGARQRVAAFRGSNSAPAWSPDGRQLTLTLSRDGGSQIFLMGRQGGDAQRLTQTGSINTESRWSPDGRHIYFVSDRGGAPQIYRMGAGGEGAGQAERVTFEGSYNTTPRVSPDGKLLAYVSRVDGNFRIHLLDLARGSGATAVTDGSDDQSPSFAPNGRLILYTTRSGGRDLLMNTTLDGSTRTPLAARRGDIREPAWGGYLA